MEYSDMANVKIERTKLWPTNIYRFNTDVSILQHHDKMETDLKVDLKENYTEIFWKILKIYIFKSSKVFPQLFLSAFLLLQNHLQYFDQK